ncbi:Adrenodoxin-like protein 2 [Argiope bruennichi]|uniref:Adrenodoxin-like protein 2 n=1 Tax=Argiope bruennichi TaxID=94029 RepID=A0A8T0F2U7_ARGBR|nr:Adrenodoxin-like protein 2 [Argiope bruennichi]
MFTTMMRRAFRMCRSISNFNSRSFHLSTVKNKDPVVVNLTLISSSGQRYEVQGNEGWSIVETVVRNNLEKEFPYFGICCGSGVCLTCMIYFKLKDFELLPEIDEDSEEFFCLEEIVNYIPGSSRLGFSMKLSKRDEQYESFFPQI